MRLVDWLIAYLLSDAFKHNRINLLCLKESQNRSKWWMPWIYRIAIEANIQGNIWLIGRLVNYFSKVAVCATLQSGLWSGQFELRSTYSSSSKQCAALGARNVLPTVGGWIHGGCDCSTVLLVLRLQTALQRLKRRCTYKQRCVYFSCLLCFDWNDRRLSFVCFITVSCTTVFCCMTS